MTQASNVAAIEKATGKSWYHWLEFMDKIGAKDLSHKEIAQRVHEAGTPGWWSQAVTVAYEQHIGRRKPGQDNEGNFSVSVTKTIDGSMDEALDAWLDLVKSKEEFSGVKISRGPEVSKTDKWRYWHCGLADGSRINMGIYQKAPDKAALGLAHEKLKSEQQIETLRGYWKKLLTKM